MGIAVDGSSRGSGAGGSAGGVKGTAIPSGARRGCEKHPPPPTIRSVVKIERKQVFPVIFLFRPSLASSYRERPGIR